MTTEHALSDIAEKIDAGERLSHDDGMRLFGTRDIHTLGELANRVRERRHGRNAYYNVNRHLNYSNLCVLRCKFCAFYVPWDKHSSSTKTDEDRAVLPVMTGRSNSGREAYTLEIDEIVNAACEASSAGATEIHIVGGLHPKLPFSYYTGMCAAIRSACPRMHIKAFTAIEIIHFTRIAKPRMSIEEVLTALREAGLGSLPGGGAEIFDDRVHDEAYKQKVGEAEWFDVHRVAHRLGIYTNATMLYGHVESPAERLGHLIKLREHQDRALEAGGAHFNCIIPLSFIPEGSDLEHLGGPTGLDDLRTLAICRLMLDNFAHVKAFWIMQSAKLAQVSLNWGVDDIDGTVVYYDITRREGGGHTHQELTVDQLRRLIHEAGCVPVERDTLYRPVIRRNGDWTIAADSSLRESSTVPIRR